MSAIKNALTRKFGPLPAWAWAGIAGIGLFLYRRHQAGMANASQSQADQQASTLGYYGPYGESQYSAGSGSGGGFSGGGGGDTSGAGTSAGTVGSGDQAPNITVNPPTANKNHKRKPKPKAQHKPKPVKHATKPSHKRRPRHPAATKEGLRPVSAAGPTGTSASGARRNISHRVTRRHRGR